MICQLWETTSESVCGSKVLATVRTLKHKAFVAFAQNNGPKDPFCATSGGIDVSDEIAALGGGGPRIISSSSPKPTSSPASSPYSPEHRGSPIPSRIPTSNGVSLDTTFSSVMAPPFAFAGVDFSSEIPEYNTNVLPSNFDEIFQSMTGGGDTAPTQMPGVGPTILEELGLGGGWQPVMDDLGL